MKMTLNINVVINKTIKPFLSLITHTYILLMKNYTILQVALIVIRYKSTHKEHTIKNETLVVVLS